MKERKVLAIYCRISRLKEEGKDRSIEDQKQLGIEKAKELGYDYELYIDEGLSAASDDIEDRPEFKRLLNDMKAGKLYAIYGIDQSRFERNPSIHYMFAAEVKNHIQEYWTDIDGLIDLHDPQVELMANIRSIFNQYHVTNTKHKVKSVLKRNARNGKAHGISPYGYTKDENGFIIIDEVESEVVKRIFNMSLQGKGTKAITNKLNAESVPTRYNKLTGSLTVKNKYTGTETTKSKASIKWAPNTIRNILKNTIYKGERVFNDEIITVPAIITPKIWDKVQVGFGERAIMGKTIYDYLLKGKLRCGKCGRNYYGRTRQDKKDHAYICSSKRIPEENCGNRGINIDRLDDLVWFRIINSELFLKVLKRDFSFSKNKVVEVTKGIETRTSTLQEVETRRNRVVTAFSHGAMTEKDLEIQLVNISKEESRLKEDIEILESKLKALNYSEELISKYHQFQTRLNYFKDGLSFEEKQAIINVFIDDIIVLFNEDKKEYELEISYLIHPSEFDKDYPSNYNTTEGVGIPMLIGARQQNNPLGVKLHQK